MEIELIIKIICGIVTLISIICSIIAKISSGKWKKISTKISAITDKTRVLMNFMAEAENHKNFSGEDKLQFVLSKYIQYCYANKIDYNEVETTSDVEQLVELTKEINYDRTRTKTNAITSGSSDEVREREQRTSTTNICE